MPAVFHRTGLGFFCIKFSVCCSVKSPHTIYVESHINYYLRVQMSEVISKISRVLCLSRSDGDRFLSPCYPLEVMCPLTHGFTKPEIAGSMLLRLHSIDLFFCLYPLHLKTIVIILRSLKTTRSHESFLMLKLYFVGQPY